MANRLEELYVPKRGDRFIPYLVLHDKLRQLDPNKLSSTMVVGVDRDRLTVATTGDISLTLRYKERDGVVSSYTLLDQDLRVDQLQGARQEGYRISTALNWAQFFADEMLEVAKHPESGVERIVMPLSCLIDGFIDATEPAARRYEIFKARASMRFSAEEKLFVRDVKS